MTLSPATRLGAYEITAPLGAGGMGEVYRATDTKLDREVAIKVLPAAFTADAERLARFEREAKLLASLNHSNIAHVYGFEAATLDDASRVHFLAMELVEGEDLSERLKGGAIPVEDAVEIAKQIAEALEAAHEKGIVHRDLKRANVKLTPAGKVKVLDFGLAKAWVGEGAGATSSADVSHSPTMTRQGTEAGMILGSAAYMSPEQARGKAVDKRADIWAFGVVLFEILTGRRLFDGETVSDVLAGVLKSEVDLGTLPASTPPAIRRLLRRCLERNPRNRLHDIADARIVLDEVIAGAGDDGSGAAPAKAPEPPWRRALPWAVGALGLAVGIGSVGVRGARPGAAPRDLPVLRFTIPLPADAPLFVESYPGRSLALSPDGTQIVYATAASAADTRFRMRRLDETEIRSLPGTENGRAPFFSPDGEWLAYFDWAESAIKKVSLLGGRAVTLGRGFVYAGWMLGTWCDDGRIVFDTWNGGLRVLSGEGGEPRILTQPTDEWHLDPQPLPGPCRVLFYSHRTEGQAIEAISAAGGARTQVLDNASHGRYLVSGHLLFVRDGALHVAPFDAERLKVTGAATPLPFDAVPDWFNVSAANPQLALSRDGTLVYAPSDEQAGSGSQLVAVAHDGQIEEVAALPFRYPTMALAPDGAALALTGRRAGVARIEALDLQRKATTALADLGAVDMPAQPVWTPDGKAILYTRYGPFEGEIVRHPLDARVPDQVLLRLPGTWLCPWSVSPDGRWLVISRYTSAAQADLLLLDLRAAPGTAAVRPLVATADEEIGAAISPNGEWFAYTLNKGGGKEIHVEKFPEGGQKTRVGSGSSPPVWSPDGREIYFTSSARGGGALEMMAARVELTPSLRVSEPRRLFSGPFMSGTDMGPPFAVTRDGRRFLMLRLPPGVPISSGTGSARQLLVVQNWFAELRRSQEGEGAVIGSRLGAYEVTASIGVGGMGEVFRARDATLNRDVAIKVLPAALASDTERLARFKREAQVLASLNHPNIAHVYGFEVATLPDGSAAHFLAMELVEGEDLAQRLKRGPIAVDEALAIAKQVAEGLEEAHEKGIVHRDLKPANIKLTPDGNVKVLDFGLAKALAGEGPSSAANPELSHSPTMSRHATEAGMILGTAAYMSPEQDRGKTVDKRADIWSFGVVLYEMFTGNRIFAGETVSDVLAAVLTREPDWSTLPTSVPDGIRRLLRRCVERNPKNRLHDIADARIELSEGPLAAAVSPPALPPPPSPWRRIAVGASLLVVGGLLGVATKGFRARPEDGPRVRFTVTPPGAGGRVEHVRFSRDGRRLVYSVFPERRLLVHDVDAFESRPLPGTEGAAAPFLSPDGAWIGFKQAGKIRKVALDGGDPVDICDLPQNTPDVAWGPGEVILFSPAWTNVGLWRVSAGGGQPVELTRPDRAKGETGHFWPDFLPDGRAVLFTIFGGKGLVDSKVGLLDLETRRYEALFEGAAVSYLDSGHILFYKGGAYRAVPFDAARRRVTGPETTVLPGVRRLDPVGNEENFVSFSTGGALAFVEGDSPLLAPLSRLTWVSREGRREDLPLEAYHDLNALSLSPDGTRAAVGRFERGQKQVYVYDLERGTGEALTRDGQNWFPTWHPDGRRLAVTSQLKGNFDVRRLAADAASASEIMLSTDADEGYWRWAPDGASGVFTVWAPGSGTDLWRARGDGSEPSPLVASVLEEGDPAFSSDGTWLAYLSGGSLYVASYPALAQRVLVAQTAERPRWSRAANELFYVQEGRLKALAYEVRGGVFRPAATTTLFELGRLAPQFDVAPDGGRLLFLVRSPGVPDHDVIRVVMNGFEELRGGAPAQGRTP